MPGWSGDRQEGVWGLLLLFDSIDTFIFFPNSFPIPLIHFYLFEEEEEEKHVRTLYTYMYISQFSFLFL